MHPQLSHSQTCHALSLPIGADLLLQIPRREIPVGCRSWETARSGHQVLSLHNLASPPIATHTLSVIPPPTQRRSQHSHPPLLLALTNSH